MGDRGVVGVKQNEGADIVYIYTHWGGSALNTDLATALRKKWRWGDEDYLTRIIYDVMAEDGYGEETGFGISANDFAMPEYPILVVDGGAQVVEVWDYKKEQHLDTISFEDFISDPDIDNTIKLIETRADYEKVVDKVADTGRPPTEEEITKDLYGY